MTRPIEAIGEAALRVPLRTPTLPPATATNALLVQGQALVVVEPATPHAEERERLARAVEATLATGRVWAGICLTHHHSDHVGAATWLRDRFGGPIRAHAATASRLDFEVDEPIDGEWTLELGDGVRLDAIATPGHAPGHLAFWERSTNVVHGGDLVAAEGTILIDPDDAGDMAVYLDSLRAMVARLSAAPEVAWVPAHGPTLRDPMAVLNHYIRHRLAREAKLLSALEGGEASEDELLAWTYDDKPADIARSDIARASLRAHVNKLVDEGRVSTTDGRLRRA